MKKILVLTVLSFIPLLVSDAKVLSTTKEDRDKVVWERLVHAICMVKSGCDDKGLCGRSEPDKRETSLFL